MKAFIINSNREYELVHNFQKPTLTKGTRTALIKVLAVALNRRDYWIGQGLYPGIKVPCVLGSDACGEVVQVGDERDNHWLGKQVMINPNIDWGDNEEIPSKNYNILGMPGDGTFREYMVVNVDRLHEKPSFLTPIQAAAIPLGGITAYRAAFTNGRVTPGKTVLVTGIGGGVAQICLQFCALAGARVFVTSSSKQKLTKAKELGAEGGVLYTEKDWDKKLLNLCPKRFDSIIDGTGGPDFGKLINLGKLGTRIVVYGATSGVPSSFNIHKLFLGFMKIIGSTMGSDKEFQEMMELINKKQFIPYVESVRPFEQIFEALDDMKNARQFGKIVLQVASPSSKL